MNITDKFKFEDNVVLPSEIIKLSVLNEEYISSDNIRCIKLDNSYIIRVTATLGKQAHPMIKIAGYTSWYTDGETGYYITGYDTEKNEFFQIIA